MSFGLILLRCGCKGVHPQMNGGFESHSRQKVNICVMSNNFLSRRHITRGGKMDGSKGSVMGQNSQQVIVWLDQAGQILIYQVSRLDQI